MAKAETTLYSIGDDKLIAIADAIRSQTETEDTMTTDDMVRKINNMLSSVQPYVGKRINSELIDGQVRSVLVPYEEDELTLIPVLEPEDSESGFDPSDTLALIPAIFERGTAVEYDPTGGIMMRQGGYDVPVPSESIGVFITLTNEDDENDPINRRVFNGHYVMDTGGLYTFRDWEPGEIDQYEISFGWPKDAVTYTGRLWAESNGTTPFALIEDESPVVEFSVSIDPSRERPQPDENEEDPEL